MISDAETHPLPPDELGAPPVEALLASAGDNQSPTTGPPTVAPPPQ